MVIETIKLHDFRNYHQMEVQPHPGINLLFGQNGSGKTNLIEAIHYCALGKSHRTNADREVVRKNALMSACGVSISKKNGRMDIAVKLTPEEARKKQVFIDRKRTSRLSDLMGQVQCVIFSPEDLMLVKDGPALRRKYMDMLLSQLSSSYFVALQQYQKAMDQRNALLREAKKTGILHQEMLEIFEQQMAQPSELIIVTRKRILARVSQIAAEKYAAISGRTQEFFEMTYTCCLPGEGSYASRILERLKKNRQEDVYRGTTSFGIHREDMALTLNGREMKMFASQGQIRTAALSMKLSQLQVFQEQTGETPILLLDDVMSELDMTRRNHLLQEIRGIQTFVTCTDESDLDGAENLRTYRVSMDSEGIGHIAQMHHGEMIASEHAGVDLEEPDFS